MRIRYAIIAAPVLLLESISGAGAQNYAWCAQYNMRGGGERNCGFVSWQQCMATVSGVGGYCEQTLCISRSPTMFGARRAATWASSPSSPVSYCSPCQEVTYAANLLDYAANLLDGDFWLARHGGCRTGADPSAAGKRNGSQDQPGTRGKQSNP